LFYFKFIYFSIIRSLFGCIITGWQITSRRLGEVGARYNTSRTVTVGYLTYRSSGYHFNPNFAKPSVELNLR